MDKSWIDMDLVEYPGNSNVLNQKLEVVIEDKINERYQAEETMLRLLRELRRV